jgi:CRP/FNR family transcriptional regulator
MDPIEIKEQLLASFPVFREMANTTVDCVIASSPVKRIPAGTVVFTPGTPCGMFPLVLSGCLRVSMAGAKGRELPLYRVRPGESCILTTTCLLGETAYSATGVSELDTCAIALAGEGFHRLIEQEPLFRTFVFRLFTDRVLELLQLVEEVAFRKLDERLAALLLAKGNPIRTTHQHLADELGSVREMISRLLRSFEERGWVALGREQIDVRDAHALRALAGAQSVVRQAGAV